MHTPNDRTKLFELGLSLLQSPSDFSISLLKTQVYNLKTAGGFVINTETEVRELAWFLNRYTLS